MKYNPHFKSVLIRIFLMLFFSLTSFNSHAFNAEGDNKLTIAPNNPKHDFVSGGGNGPNITTMDQLMSL